MPTLAQVINKINSDITANGNEEITGLVLNSVLLDMVSQINDLVGELGDLSTDDVTSIVNAINSLKDELDNYINSQVGTLTGNDDPNDTEPVGFDGRVGTIYLKMMTVGVQTTPESYWIYTGINDIGWLNLTADDTFKMVVVDHYEDLPAQGQTNRIYFVQDENNTYIWNVNIFPNDYVLVGGVIEGEYIDDTTFNNEFGNPVVPNTGNLYLDTVTGKYYRWDGNYFLPIDQDTGGGIESIQEGANISIDNTDPQNPIISALEGDTPTLSEVLAEGNLIDGYFGTVIEFENPHGANHYIFYEDGILVFGIGSNGLFLNGDNYIHLKSDVELKFNNQIFPSTAGTNGQVLTTDGTNMSWEDVVADFSDLTNNVIPKKSPGGNELEDSKATETTTGISVDGRTDTDLVIEKAVNATGITTAYAIDLGAGAGNFNLTLSGATDFSFSNMIVEGQSCVFTLIINNPGENAFQFPIWLKEDPDSDDASTLDRVVIHIHKGGVSPDGTYQIKNL